MPVTSATRPPIRKIAPTMMKPITGTAPAIGPLPEEAAAADGLAGAGLGAAAAPHLHVHPQAGEGEEQQRQAGQDRHDGARRPEGLARMKVVKKPNVPR